MERSLAHIEEVTQVDVLPGYDRVASAHILGWRVVVSKEEIKAGDKVVYFEIDSLLPANDKRFAFMEKKHYKVKTQKMCKSLSQGLAMPLSLFPELGDPEIGTDVTKELKITYYNGDDRQRKSSGKINKNDKYKRMKKRLPLLHPNFFKTKLCQYFIRREWGTKILYFFFGNDSKDLPKKFPSWISKSDQTRVENIPWVLEDSDQLYEITEKLDGTSCSYGVNRIKKDKYDYAVCSRNVRQINEDEIPYCTFDTNVYIEMSKRYNIEKKLLDFVKENDIDTMYIQGECIGSKVQNNPYKYPEGVRELFLFEICINGKKQSYQFIKDWAKERDMKYVPLINTKYKLPDNMEEMKKFADGYSEINPKIKREGFVYRNVDNSEMTFKNVSNDYLLKHS